MLRCFGGNDREFVSNPLEGTENCSTHSLRNSLLSSRSPPLFSGVSTAKGIIREFVGGLGLVLEGEEKKKKKFSNQVTYTNTCSTKLKIGSSPTTSGSEEIRTGPFKLMQ